MADNMSFSGEQRAREEDFFHKRERELMERMRSQEQAEAGLRQLAEVTGIVDDALLRDLQGHGFHVRTAKLLDLAPLVLVAWSDGSVAPQERKEILLVARVYGIDEGVPGYGQLAGWLEARPPDDFFQLMFRALRAAMDLLSPEERERRVRELLSRSVDVAKVSGGFLGVGSKISAAERLAIRQVAERLGCAEEVVQGIEKGRLS
jgi:hypothetical protein